MDLNVELNDISNYEGYYKIKLENDKEILSYTDKPIIDFRFIILNDPIQSYRESFGRMITILNDHYSVKAAKNKSLIIFLQNVQMLHFIITKQPNKKPINIFGPSIETLYEYFNLRDIPIEKVKREDKYIDAYGQVLWKYLHSASILAEHSSEDSSLLRQSTILYLNSTIRQTTLYQNPNFSNKVFTRDDKINPRSTRNINAINQEGNSLHMDNNTKNIQTYFLRVVSQFYNALLCARCYNNFLNHQVVENLIIPAYFTRSMIGTIFNLHNLVNLTKDNRTQAYSIEEFCKNNNLELVTVSKFYLTKDIIISESVNPENEIILRPLSSR